MSNQITLNKSRSQVSWSHLKVLKHLIWRFQPSVTLAIWSSKLHNPEGFFGAERKIEIQSINVFFFSPFFPLFLSFILFYPNILAVMLNKCLLIRWLQSLGPQEHWILLVNAFHVESVVESWGYKICSRGAWGGRAVQWNPAFVTKPNGKGCCDEQIITFPI